MALSHAMEEQGIRVMRRNRLNCNPIRRYAYEECKRFEKRLSWKIRNLIIFFDLCSKATVVLKSIYKKIRKFAIPFLHLYTLSNGLVSLKQLFQTIPTTVSASSLLRQAGFAETEITARLLTQS